MTLSNLDIRSFGQHNSLFHDLSYTTYIYTIYIIHITISGEIQLDLEVVCFS